MDVETGTATAVPDGAAAPATVSDKTASPAAQDEGSTASATVEDGEDTAAKTDEAQDEGAKPDKPKRDGGFQKRIRELTREYREAERRAAEAEKRAAFLDGQLQARQPAKTSDAASSTEPSALKPEDFASYDDYIIAKAEARIEQRRKQEEDRRTQEQRKRDNDADAERIRGAIRKAVDQARDQYPDFDDVVSGADVTVTEPMARYLAESEKTAGLMYWLGQNDEEARRISALPPYKQARELARIEFTKLDATPKRTVSAAPTPAKTVAAQGGGVKDPSKMSYSEFKAWRDAGGGA